MKHIRYKSVQSEKIKQNPSMSRASRFYTQSVDPIPGPGSYFTRGSQSPGVKFSQTKRSSFYQIPESPSPGSYDLPSSFNQKKPSFSPKSFKNQITLKKLPFNDQFFLQVLTQTNSVFPDIHESYQKTQSKPRRAIFGSEKRKDNFFNPELAKNPGPGEYSQRSSFGEGPRWRFGSDLSRRYAEIEEIPGPGAYNSPTTLSSMVFKFPSGRKSERLSELPGPGQYDVVKNLKYKSFAVSKAEKFQRLSGPALPGPSDYNVSSGRKLTTSSCTNYKLHSSLSEIDDFGKDY
jgi:hypothetical protein